MQLRASIVASGMASNHNLRAPPLPIFYIALMRFTPLLLCLSVALTAGSAGATSWEIIKKHSKIQFEAMHDGEPFTGSFPKYDAQISLDPETLWDANIRIRIPLASVLVEGRDRQLAITGESWFDTATYATATFESRNIERNGDDYHGTANDSLNYIAYGELTIRGITHDVEVHFTAVPRGENVHAKGYFDINRRDYFVGTGQWASSRWVGHRVRISFDFLARPETATAKPE